MEVDQDGRCKEGQGPTKHSHEILPQWAGMETSEGGRTENVWQWLQRIYGRTKRPDRRTIQEPPR